MVGSTIAGRRAAVVATLLPLALVAAVLAATSQQVSAVGDAPTFSEWSAPLAISTDAVNATQPKLAMDAEGNATAVWLEPVASTTNKQLFSSYKAFGGSWSTPAQVSDGSATISLWDFDLNASGEGVLVWRAASTGAEWRVRDARVDHGVWTSPLYLFPYTGSKVDNDLDVEVDSDGDPWVVWSGDDPDNTTPQDFTDEVFIYDGGVRTLSDGLGTLPDDQGSGRPSIAITGTDRVLVQWTTTLGSGNAVIRAVETQSSGAWGSMGTLSDPADDAHEPRSWGNPSGGYVRTRWVDTDGGEQVLHAAAFNDDGTDSAALTYDAPDVDGAEARSVVFTAGLATMSMAMVDASSNVYLRISHRPDGGEWTAPYEPLGTRTGISSSGALAADAAGVITMAIAQGPGSQRVKVHQLAPGGTLWTREQGVSDATVPGNATAVGVAAGPAGSAMVIWQQQVAGFTRILTSHVLSTQNPSPSPTVTTTPTATTTPTVDPVPTTPTASVVTSPPVVQPPLAALVKVASPSVSGKARVGRTLKAKAGLWQPTPTKVTYQWRAGTKNIKRATTSKLKLSSALKSKRISVRITVSAPGVPSVSLTVKVTGKVR